MGGAVSAGETNDELMDHLVEAGYVRSKNVELLLKAIDRAHFFDSESKNLAYRDLAWRRNHVHLSAPCIYAEVIEALELPPLRPYLSDDGQSACARPLSFLNVGSGTLYLSTLVGLALGPHAVHHAVELHADVVQYACERVRELLRSSDSLQQYELCLPRVVCGNALLLDACLPPPPSASASASSSASTSASPSGGLLVSTNRPPPPAAASAATATATPAAAGAALHLHHHLSASSALGADSVSARSRLSSGFVEGDRDSALSLEAPSSTSFSAAAAAPASEPEPEMEMETERHECEQRQRQTQTQTRVPFLYDRIYCGAAVQEAAHEQLFKRLLKVNGILVMPLRDSLVQVRRVSEHEWHSRDLLSVSFMPLVAPRLPPASSDSTANAPPQLAEDEPGPEPEHEHDDSSGPLRNPAVDRPISLPDLMPASLQHLSRVAIRACLRHQILAHLPPLPPSTVELRTKRLAAQQQKDEEAMSASEQSPTPRAGVGAGAGASNQQQSSSRSWFSMGSSLASFVGARLGLGGGGGHTGQHSSSSAAAARAAGGFAPVDPNPAATARRPDHRDTLFLRYRVRSKHRHRRAASRHEHPSPPQTPQTQQTQQASVSTTSATAAPTSSSTSASNAQQQHTQEARPKRSSGLSHWLPWSSSRSSTASGTQRRRTRKRDSAGAAATAASASNAGSSELEPRSFTCSAFRAQPRGPLVLCLPRADGASRSGLPAPVPASSREDDSDSHDSNAHPHRLTTIAGLAAVALSGERRPHITAIHMRNSNALLVSVCLDSSETDEFDSPTGEAPAPQPVGASAAASSSANTPCSSTQPNSISGNQQQQQPSSIAPLSTALLSSDIDPNQSISSSTIAMHKHSCFCGFYNLESAKQSSRQSSSSKPEAEAGGIKRQTSSSGGLRGLLPSFFSRGRTPGAKRVAFAHSARSGSLSSRNNPSRRHERHLSDQMHPLPLQLPKSRTWNEELQAQQSEREQPTTMTTTTLEAAVRADADQSAASSSHSKHAARACSSLQPPLEQTSSRRRSASTASSASGVPPSCSGGTSLRSLGRSLVSRVFTSSTSSAPSNRLASASAATAAQCSLHNNNNYYNYNNNNSTATVPKLSFVRSEAAEADSARTARPASGRSSQTGAEPKTTLIQFLRDKKNELFTRNISKSKEHSASRDPPMSERIREHSLSEMPPESPTARHHKSQQLQAASFSLPQVPVASVNSSASGDTQSAGGLREDFGWPAARGVPVLSAASEDVLVNRELSSVAGANASTVSASVYPGFRGRMQLAVDKLPLPPPLRSYLMLELD